MVGWEEGKNYVLFFKDNITGRNLGASPSVWFVGGDTVGMATSLWGIFLICWLGLSVSSSVSETGEGVLRRFWCLAVAKPLSFLCFCCPDRQELFHPLGCSAW